jgi:hypothetical protein
MGSKSRAVYWVEARMQFLKGTRFRSPFEAVEAGARTVQEWCDVLASVKSESGVRADLEPELAASPELLEPLR